MSTVEFADLVRLIEINGLLAEKELAALKSSLDKSIDPKKLLFKLLQANKITKWQAKQLVLGNERLKIGNLILTDEIGETNIGGLYRAKQIGLDRPVMLLLLTEQYHNDPQMLESFGKRIGIFSNIISTALVRPLEIKKDDDQVVVLMDDYQGEDLFQYIKEKGPLSKHECVKNVRELAGLLADMHTAGEVHGDLTPSSIIVNQEGKARLLCFNPVHVEDVAIAEHQQYFASPQAEQSPQDPANDLYSLGRIGLFMLTGDLPEGDVSTEQKSPLISLFARMASTDKKTSITSPQRVVALLDRWLEVNAQAPEPIVVPEEDNGLGVSSEDYQSDSSAGALNFGVDYAQSRVQERLQKRKPKAQAVPAADAKSTSGETATVTDGDEQAADQEADKKFPLALVLGIAGGLGAVLLLFGVGLVALWILVLAPKFDKQVAAADEQAETGVVDPAADAKTDQVAAEEKTEKKDEPVVSDLAQGAFGETDEEKAAENGKAGGDTKEDAGKSDTATPVNPDGENKANTNPENKTDVPGKGDEPDKTSPNPEVAVNPEPEKTKPEETESPKNEPQPPAVDPLAEVPSVLAVPELGTPKSPGENYDQPKALAKITLHPADFFLIDLHGGKKAYKDESSFELKEVAGAVGERKWQVRFTPNTKVASKVDIIADMKIENGEMIFQWRKEALPLPGAGSFRNCLLALKTGNSLKPVALRNPVPMLPIVLDEKTLNGKTEAKIDDLPEMDALNVEIMMPATDFPAHSFKGKTSISAVKGETVVMFGEPTHEYLTFGIESRGRGKIVVSLESLLQSAEGAGVKYPGRKKMEDSIEPKTNLEKVYADELTKLKALTATKEISNQISIGQLALNRLKENNLRTKAFMTVLGQLENREIPVRVYYQAGEYQVDLATPEGKPLASTNQK